MVGRTLNHYQVLAKIGQGGMGEVYAAEDTRLKRRVALKVLPPHLAAHADRRARFEREAQAVAALHHPHIVTIHSVEEADGVHFITMELVDGKRLSDLIPRDGMTLGRTLEVAIPLCDALTAAHQRGITHRDLKPDNVMISSDGRLKVLDFGLAKLQDASSSSPSQDANTAALGSDGTMTQEGQILGTAAYMSPEQAEGRPADARSDVFALGILLFEVASGKRPFQGDTPASMLAAILRDQPPSLSDVKATVPRALAHVIRRCLHKQPDRRYQSAIEVRNELEELKTALDSGTLEAPPAVARRAAGRRWLVPASVLVVAGAVAAVLLVRDRRPVASVAQAPTTFALTRLTSHPGVERSPSLSPDGKLVAFAGAARGTFDVYVQRVGGENPANLTPGCAKADVMPAFSPEGDRIAYRSECEGGGLFVMGATGESARRVIDRGYNPAWSPDGTRLAFATEGVETYWSRGSVSEIWTVDVATGRAERISQGDAVQPAWSPHGRRIAYWGLPEGQGRRDLWTVPADGGEPVPLTSDDAVDWSPVWSPDGYLYFSSDRGGAMDLWRVRVDEETGKVAGAFEPVTTGGSAERGLTSTAAGGRRIAYTETVSRSPIYKVGFDPRAGAVVGSRSLLTPGGLYAVHVHASPDGEWLAYETGAWQQEDIFVIRADGTGRRQLTTDRHKDRRPRWSPDGKRLAFYTNRAGTYEIFTIRVDGSGLRQVSPGDGTGAQAPNWSPDGKHIVYSFAHGARSQIVPADPDAGGGAHDLDPYEEGGAAGALWMTYSPDGRWFVAQRRRPDGTSEGIVLYALAARKYELLVDFGTHPEWLGDSRRMLFLHEGRVHLLDRVTREHREILAPEGGAEIGRAAPSPDGRTLYFTQTETEADVWMLERR